MLSLSASDPNFCKDPDPGKNLHADSDLGGIRGVKAKKCAAVRLSKCMLSEAGMDKAI